MLEQGYGIMPNVVLKDTKISSTSKLLYVLVSSLSAKEGYCYASNKYLADELSTTDRTIRRKLAELRDAGYLEVGDEDETGGRHLSIGVPEMSGGRTKMSGGADKNVHHNNISNNINKKIYTKKDETDSGLKTNPSVVEIYRYYLEVFDISETRYRLTNKRAEKIKTRLKEYSLEEIKRAIRNCYRDDFYSGRSGKWAADLFWICKNEENVAKMLELQVEETEDERILRQKREMGYA